MSATSLAPRPGLFIGGLRSDLHPGRLAGLISGLLRRFQVNCPKQNVHICNGQSSTYALVDLPDDESQAHLLSEFSDVSNVLNAFDLSTITDNPGDFYAKPRKHERGKKQRSKSRSKKNRRNKVKDGDKDAAELQEDFSLTSLYRDDNFGSIWFHRAGEFTSDARNQKSQTSLPTANQSANQKSSATNLSVHRGHSGNSIQGTEVAGKESGLTGLPPLPQEKTSQLSSGRPVAVSDHGLLNITQKSTATSTTGLPTPAQVSTTTSTPGTAMGLGQTFYRLGQIVGRESRHSEFKAGGMTQKERGWLQDTVGKYVCGFLNSAEGGTLYVGVNDSGRVIGFPCTQAQEDDYRLLIDEALKNIEPAIFPDKYSVRFVPVMEENGRLSDRLQVLEVQAYPIKVLKNLYDFRGHAYIRRDGSLQGPLKARQVQEWTRKQIETEHFDSWQLKIQLQEMTLQLENERRKNREMQEKLTDLEDQRSEVPLERKKSRICNIM